jgi:hypothetical protein
MRYNIDIHVSAVVEAENQQEAEEIASATVNDFSTVCDLPYPSFDSEVEVYGP